MSPRFIITGGGTGGHVFPAISIAEEMRDRGFDVTYVGNPRGMEARLAPQHSIPFVPVRSGQFKNRGIRSLISFVITAWSILEMLVFLRRTKPKAVLTVGGYIGVPCSVAAFLLRIPLFIQEQNASVGIANRFLGRFATSVFLGFDQAKKYFGSDKCLTTGNPLRKEFFRKDFPNPNSPPKRLFIFGGSQGAHAINQAVTDLLPRIQTKFPEISIIHQTGKSDHDKIEKIYQEKFQGDFKVRAFIDDMISEYSQADVVLSRSGALTISELIVVGRPAILVPYPRSGQNDQVDNAKFLQECGVATMVEQGHSFEDRLWEALLKTLDPPHFQAKLGRFDGLQRKNALATIGRSLEEALSER